MTPRALVSEAGAIEDAVAGLTIPRAFRRTADRRADEVALRWRDGMGARSWTWRELSDQARRFAAGLLTLGVGDGDRVLTMMRNRAEFHAVDLAVQMIGAVPVAVFNSSSPDQLVHLARHCGAVMAVVGNPELQQRFLRARAYMPSLRHVVTLDDESGSHTYAQLVSAAPIDLDEACATTAPDSLATLIYTSGTTGPPKAVMMTQRNACWMIEATRRAMGTTMDGWRVISYMPMAHVAERTLSYWMQVMHGSEVTICSDPQALGAVLLEARPHFFGAVPRVWEKMHAGISAGLASDPVAAAGFRDALATGLHVGQTRVAGRPVPAQLQSTWDAAQEVLSPYKARVGLDACRMALTGSAPTPAGIFDFFLGLGIPISETYGFSEGGQITGWNPTAIRPGTVGRPLPGVEVDLADDGELLVRGGSVFAGYLGDPTRTAQALDDDGWYRTGDLASIDDDGYVSVVDRKKELIITATGENVSPANLQNALKSCELIGQACAIGDGRPYVTALVTLSPETALPWARAAGISTDDAAALARDPRVRAEVDRQVAEANATLSHVEQIKRFVILPDEWLPDSDELTPTMKVKRKVVLTKYADEIESLYL